MLSISHGLSGALLATKLGHPLLFIPACLAIHYLQDWIPHWDVGTGLSNGLRKKSTTIGLELIELIITVGLIYIFWKPAGDDVLWLAAIGAFCALLPDFMEAPRNFLNWEPAFLRPLNKLHARFHHSAPNMILGLAPQLVTVVTVWLLR